MIKTTNNEYKAINFTFAIDPLSNEKELFKKFKDAIKSNPEYYKYKDYLRELTRLRSWNSFFERKSIFIPDLQKMGMFWTLGGLIYSAFQRNQGRKNIAIVFRCIWTVEIEKETKSEVIKDMTFFDYEFPRTILEIY